MDYWIVIVVPFLVLLSPRVIRYVVALFLHYRKRGDKRSLQAQIKDYRKELAAISQVNEFAKYSKVQRKLRATSDQLNSLAKQDLELTFKYAFLGQAFAWLLAVIFSFRLVYQVYYLALYYSGYGYAREEKLAT